MAYAQGPDSAGIPSVVAISGIAGTSTGPSTVTEQMQRNDTNYGLLSYYAGGKPIATVYRTCEVAPTLGVKDIEDANGTNAAYSANPTNLAHFVVTVAPRLAPWRPDAYQSLRKGNRKKKKRQSSFSE